MTITNKKVYIGIDISKDTLDVTVFDSEEYWHLNNNIKELHNLAPQLKDLSPTLIVVEASGGLEQPVVRELCKENLPVAIANPTRVRNFARSTGQLAKTDKLDAKIIAQYAQAVNPKVRPLRTAQQEHLDALVTRRRQIVDTITAEKNRLSTTHPALLERLKRHIDWLEEELQALDDEINKFIQQNAEWKQKPLSWRACQVLDL